MEMGSSSISLLSNRYQLQQPLGSGGMSVVYLARDLMLDRLVAVKILRFNLSQDASFRERFRHEARAAANLSHPNIVTVHDFGLDGERLFIVMEYIHGKHLKSMIDTFGRFSIEETIFLMIQASEGIGYAHRAGLIHCDIKPQNLIVTLDKRLKVADFGIARALSTIQPDEQTNIVWGSPQYISPEQAAGSAPLPASDVYSIGIILYEMLTGELPFKSSDPQELIRLHQEMNPKPPSQINAEIPQALEQVVLKVLSKEPAARYRTADQLSRILIYINNQDSSEVSDYKLPDMVAKQNGELSQPVPMSLSQKNIPIEPKKDLALNIDWITISLGLFTLLSVGGLIPFWLYVWFNLTSNRPIP